MSVLKHYFLNLGIYFTAVLFSLNLLTLPYKQAMWMSTSHFCMILTWTMSNIHP